MHRQHQRRATTSTSTAQLRKSFDFGLDATLGYSFTEAKNNLKSTEIASVLWQSQPVQGNPNNPELSFSEFGQKHRIVGGATYVKSWSPSLRTSIGLFVEVAAGQPLRAAPAATGTRSSTRAT